MFELTLKTTFGEYTIKLNGIDVSSYEALSQCFNLLHCAGYQYGLKDFDESTMEEMVKWYIEESSKLD